MFIQIQHTHTHIIFYNSLSLSFSIVRFLRLSISSSLLFIQSDSVRLLISSLNLLWLWSDCRYLLYYFMNWQVYIRWPYHRLGEKGRRVKYCQYRLRLISWDSKTLYGGQLFSVMCSYWEDLEGRWWRNSSFSCALLITRQRLAWFELFAHLPLAFLIRPVLLSLVRSLPSSLLPTSDLGELFERIANNWVWNEWVLNEKKDWNEKET